MNLKKMLFWRKWPIFVVVVIFFTVILTANIYLVYTVVEESYPTPRNPNAKSATSKSMSSLIRDDGKKIRKQTKPKGRYYVATGPNQLVASIKAAKKIKNIAADLMPFYQNSTSQEYKSVVKRITNNLKQIVKSSSKLWKTAEKWATGIQILPSDAPLLGSILDSLCSLKIIKAENSRRGTQLKLLLTLEGGQQVLFKPQWYSRSEIIKGPVYAGKDRHNAEVAAFHLSLLLDIRRVPLTVGRKIYLKKEIVPVASKELLNTIYENENDTCFYGVCLYCELKSSVCAKNDIVEGAVIMWLPPNMKFERHANPWQRSYKNDLVARWEVEENYCKKVKDTKQFHPKFSFHLLDLIDATVFDFLLDNGDRHHYEVPVGLYPSSVFLFDNGKSFGNPFEDHLDILAPLYQCCIIRKQTYERLKMFVGGALSSSLDRTLRYSHIYPVLTDSHLKALDRRLILILATVEMCTRENDVKDVLL